MPTEIYIQVINTTLIIMAVMGGFVFLRRWLRMRDEESHYQRKMEEMRYEEFRYQREMDERRMKDEREVDQPANDEGGFISLNLPENYRSLFHDLLKGFEEFASLKGYRILFSSKSPTADQISFRFVVDEEGVTVSTRQVREDFLSYIKKVENGDDFSDMPIVTSPQEHDLLLTTLKNRINFLEHSYKLERSTVEYLERLLDRTSSGRFIHQSPPVLVQTGGVHDSRNYIADQSPRAVLGDASEATIVEDYSIRIAKSFNQRQEQVSSIEEFVKALAHLKDDSNQSDVSAAVENLNKISEEIKEEDEPSGSRIKRWLENTKTYLECIKLTPEAGESLGKMAENLGAADLLSKFL